MCVCVIIPLHTATLPADNLGRRATRPLPFYSKSAGRHKTITHRSMTFARKQRWLAVFIYKSPGNAINLDHRYCCYCYCYLSPRLILRHHDTTARHQFKLCALLSRRKKHSQSVADDEKNRSLFCERCTHTLYVLFSCDTRSW